MMRNVVLGLFLIIFLWSCEKENPNVNQTELSYFPMTTGSYWVYNTYEIDAKGCDSLISACDTVKVVGDTLFRDEKYKIFRGKNYGFGHTIVDKYYRDSAGYIVNSTGNIVFQPKVTGDTLYQTIVGDSLAHFYTIGVNQGDVLVERSLYSDVLNCEFFIDLLSIDTVPQMANDYFFAPQVGLILEEYGYFNELITMGKYYQERLVDYYIAPN
jgi:hypothetical protein